MSDYQAEERAALEREMESAGREMPRGHAYSSSLSERADALRKELRWQRSIAEAQARKGE